MAIKSVPSVFATINLALADCSIEGGDIVEIAGGTYNETIDLRSPSGGWLLPVIIRAADPEDKPIITSTGAAQCVRGDSIMKASSTGQPTIDDLVFSGWDAATNGVLYFVADETLRGCTVIVRRCEFIGNTGQTCIKLVGTTTTPGYVERCLFQTSGKSIQRNSNYASIYNCVAIQPLDTPFESGSFLTATYIRHNSVYGTWDAGAVKVMSGASLYHANNIENVGSGASYAIDATGGTYSENVVYGTWTVSAFAGTDGGGNQTADPLFTDPGTADLTTPAGSPCFRSCARTITETYDGVSRADPTDAGAFEAIEPTVLGTITVLGDDLIRVDFSGGPNPDPNEPELVNIANWTIAKEAPDIGVALEVTEVTPAVDGAYVDLTLDREQTDGQVYILTVSGVPGLT